MVVMTVALLVMALVFTAGALNRTDAKRQRATEALRRLSEQIRDLNRSSSASKSELQS